MILTLLLISLFGVQVLGNCLYGTSRFPSNESAFGEWGYGVDNGPLTWSKLSPNNSLCSSGSAQSPIDIVRSIPPPSAANIRSLISSSEWFWTPIVEGRLFNLGTSLQVRPEGMGDGGLVMDNVTFMLKQFHFHTPGEHRVNGESFPMEMHLVQESADGKILILGIPFDISGPHQKLHNDFLWKLSGLIPEVSEAGKSVDLGMNGGFTMEEVSRVLAGARLAEYTGSLTTPPCTEGMRWIVSRDPMLIDPNVYTVFKRVMKYNARILEASPGSPNVLMQLVGKNK